MHLCKYSLSLQTGIEDVQQSPGVKLLCPWVAWKAAEGGCCPLSAGAGPERSPASEGWAGQELRAGLS